MRKLPIISGIYCITNTISQKQYIGSTKNFYKRKRSHINKLNRNQHDNIILQRSWNKHGSESFKFKIIEKTTNLLKREQHYLDAWKPQFNIGKHSSGGDNLSNHPRRKEIIQQIKNTILNRFKTMSLEERESIRKKFLGEKNSNYGNKWTKQQRKRASQYRKDHPYSKEHYDKMIAASIKVTQSPKHRKYLSEIRKGTGNTFYGKHHSQSTKNKISKTKQYFFRHSTPEEKYTINPQIRKVRIDDIVYFGVAEAARQIDVCPATICHRIKSPNPKFKNYHYEN